MALNRRLALSIALFPVMLGTSLSAQDFTQQQLDFFENQVRPLLVDSCFECHGPEADPPEGGLSLASRAAIIQGGDSGPAIDLQNVDGSLLIDAINYGDLFEMPPDSKLPDEKIEILTRWVEMGAPWPDTDEHQAAVGQDFDLQQRRNEHWCWQPITRPVVPQTNNGDWPRDDIDAFILQRLETIGLEPAPETSREIWIRRVYFDLIGLPPTPQDIDAFLADESADAYEKVVDRLLASPRFGERWARHWMDLIRYAETCGHEFDYPLPHAWQYRDYLIRAFNEDVPYDQLIREHVAGDLLQRPRRNPDNQINESILGTGFWFLGEATHGPVDVKGDEAGHIDNQIDVLYKTFLGLTVACARCHDHKFDAISTQDYYAISGFLQSSRRQLVMLDPEQKIQSSFQHAQNLRTSADDVLAELQSRIQDKWDNHKPYWDSLPIYIQSAVQVLHTDNSWLVPPSFRIEAESLEPLSHGGGAVQQQSIKDHDDFKWSNGKQLWWIDGSPGDVLQLQLEVPAAGQYRLKADFTTARDYAKMRVKVNGHEASEEIDLYSEKVHKTGEVDLGQFELPAGKTSIEIEITGSNDAAEPRHMVGVDYFEFVATDQDKKQQARAAAVEAFVTEKQLDRELLLRWVTAISDQQTSDPDHPFHVLRLAASAGPSTNEGASIVDAIRIDLDEFRQDLNERQKKYDAWTSNAVKFADFEQGNLSGWYRTGFAFGNSHGSEPVSSWRFDMSRDTVPLATPGVAHSGLYGSRFYGVLRSPTFEITHPFIHYRMMGSDVQIRLIVDGYVLDLNNPLLFHDFSFKFSSPDKFVWRTQRGDVKNYIGHRAHIEIIDHGDGDVQVDEIWMSDHEQVPDAPNTMFAATGKAEQQADSDQDEPPIQQVSRMFAAGFVRNVPETGSSDERLIELQNYVLTHGLLPDELVGEAMERLAEVRRELRENNRQTPRPKFAVGITDGSPENEFVFIRGNHRNLGDVAPRKPITALVPEGWRLPEQGSGRLELAESIATLQNPLTARVAVNRLWHHLTGRGLVGSVDNFGVLGEEPTHPELLDYLATEFVNDGWSIKRMIRRIVLSQTYRMSSDLNPAAAEADPDNQWLHRARIRRLQGEAIRDAMLQISGRLETTMYGPGVPIHLTPFMDGRGRPGKSGPLDGEGRRSVYIEVRRNFLHPFMLAFDTPVPFNAIGRRTVSNVPAQALILLNDPFVAQQAKTWATRLLETPESPQERIQRIYRAGIGRPPTEAEIRRSIAFLHEQADEMGISASEIPDNLMLWSDVCHVVFNVKEFIFIR